MDLHNPLKRPKLKILTKKMSKNFCFYILKAKKMIEFEFEATKISLFSHIFFLSEIDFMFIKILLTI